MYKVFESKNLSNISQLLDIDVTQNNTIIFSMVLNGAGGI